jgi:hypothetical protein
MRASDHLHGTHDIEFRLNGRISNAVTAGRKWNKRPIGNIPNLPGDQPYFAVRTNPFSVTALPTSTAAPVESVKSICDPLRR